MKPLKAVSSIRTRVRLLALPVSLGLVQSVCAYDWDPKFV